MKRIIMTETFDGKLHKTEKDAVRHLDIMYTNAVSEIAVKLTQYGEGKYQKTKDWIDSNLELFIQARRIKDDFAYPQDDDIEEDE